MALSLPKKIVVEATNKTGTTLIKGYVCQIIATRTSADGNLVYEAYRYDRGAVAGSTVLDQIVATFGVCESLTLADDDTGSFCVAGDTVAYCDADGADIDDEMHLFVSDNDETNAVPFSLTNNALLSSNNNSAANVALSGVLGATELETVLTGLRGRTCDPFGGAAGDGQALLASAAQGNVKIVIFNNPTGIVG